MKAALALLAALLAGCAAPKPEPEPPPLRPAFEALVVGESTRADARAALGEPVVVDFPSGYEVWVYHERKMKDERKKKADKPEPRIEYVLLFAPDGIVSKKRIR